MNDNRIPKPDLVELLREAGYRWTLADEVGEFWADVRECPMLAAVCAALGFIAGLFVTVGLAYVWSLFL